MKSHIVRRGVLLAVHTGSLDIFTRTLPQVADQRINRTGSPLHQPGSKFETGKWDRKVVAKPQTSPKGSKKSKWQLLCFKCSRSEGLCTCIRQESGFEPFTSDKQERDCIFICKLFCCKCSFCQVETYPGPEHLEHLPKHRVIQNGDPRDNKDLPTARAP